MSNNEEQLADILKRAIRGEQEGHFFYNLLAGKVENPEAKRKLENLRDDEIRHEKTLREIYGNLVGGEPGKLPEHGIGVLSEVFRRGHLEERKTEQEFIALAIEAELAATRFYQDKREATDNPKYRALFDRLAEEEHSHYELLQAEKEALAGNYHWFSYDEGAPLEH